MWTILVKESIISNLSFFLHPIGTNWNSVDKHLAFNEMHVLYPSHCVSQSKWKKRNTGAQLNAHKHELLN